MFDWLDNPGAAVRNVLTGNYTSAAKNMADLLTFEQFDFQKAKDTPNFGLIGNIITDPLTYVGGFGLFKSGGIHAFRGVKTGAQASKVMGGALSRTARNAINKHARTVAGTGVFKNLSHQAVRTNILDDLAEASYKSYQAVDEVGDFSKLPHVLQENINILKPETRSFLREVGVATEKLLEPGGFKVGLPFMEGTTIAREGKKSLVAAALDKYGNTINSIPFFSQGRDLLRKFYPTTGMPRISKIEFGEFRDKIRVADTTAMEAAKEVVRIGKDVLNKESREKIGRVALDAYSDMVETHHKILSDSWGAVETLDLNKINSSVFEKVNARVLSKLDASEQQVWGQMTTSLQNMLKAEHKAGMWTDIEFAQLSQNPFYVPLMLSKEGRLAFGFDKAYTRTLSRARKIVRESEGKINLVDAFKTTLKESALDIPDDILESLVEMDVAELVRHRTRQSINYTAKLEYMQNLAETVGVDPYIRLADDAAEQVGNLIQPKKMWELQDEVVNAANAAEREDIVSIIAKQRMGDVPPRSPLGKHIAKVNNYQKAALTVWHPAFHVRNTIEAVLRQALQERGIEGSLDTLKAIKDGIWTSAVGKFITKDGMSMADNIPPLEAILRNASDDVLKNMDMGGGFNALQMKEELLEKVLGRDFYDIELTLGKTIDSAPTAQSFMRKIAGTAEKLNEGARSFAQAAENRFRAANYVALRKEGYHAAEAAQIVKDAFVDYSYASATHRLVRDVFPFAQFTIGTLPGLVKKGLETPRFLTPYRELSRPTDDLLLPEYLQDQPRIKVPWDSPTGDPQILAGFGLGVDLLGRIGSPTKLALTMLHPTPKYFLQKAVGKDVFFGTDFPSYAGPLGITPGQRAGIGAAGGGRILATVEQIYRGINEEEKSTINGVLRAISGGKIYDIDQDRQARDLIMRWLQEQVEAGDAGKITRFFAKEPGQTGPSIEPEDYKQLQEAIRFINRKKQ